MQWDVIGDDALFAKGQSSSNKEGKAIFSNLEYPSVFNTLNNNQNNFRFSAHYSINNVNKKKVKAYTIKKGDQVELEIFLD